MGKVATPKAGVTYSQSGEDGLRGCDTGKKISGRKRRVVAVKAWDLIAHFRLFAQHSARCHRSAGTFESDSKQIWMPGPRGHRGYRAAALIDETCAHESLSSHSIARMHLDRHMRQPSNNR